MSFDSHFGWVLIHILGEFWFTFWMSFDSHFRWVLIHILDEFWFTFSMSFDSHFWWVLIHILNEFWFTFWVSFDSHFRWVLIHILGELWVTFWVIYIYILFGYYPFTTGTTTVRVTVVASLSLCTMQYKNIIDTLISTIIVNKSYCPLY